MALPICHDSKMHCKWFEGFQHSYITALFSQITWKPAQKLLKRGIKAYIWNISMPKEGGSNKNLWLFAKNSMHHEQSKCSVLNVMTVLISLQIPPMMNESYNCPNFIFMWAWQSVGPNMIRHQFTWKTCQLLYRNTCQYLTL